MRERAARTLILILLCLYASIAVLSAGASAGATGPVPSKKASDSCARKIKALEKEASRANRRSHPSTRITEDEINSYLALELRAKFHPSLNSLQVSMQENSLSGTAEIDFDNLSMSSTKAVTRMIAKLFSGVHKLTVRGKLISSEGKGSFELEEARFDGNALPNFLVSEIITAVGKKQRPPFDPLQPTPMPYAIQKVDLHAGYIMVTQ